MGRIFMALFVQRRNGQRYRSVLIDRLWLMGWLGGQRTGRHTIEKSVARRPKEKGDRPSQAVQSVKISVPHVNGHQSHQRATSAEEDFFNEVARMASLAANSHSCHCPRGSQTKQPCWEG